MKENELNGWTVQLNSLQICCSCMSVCGKSNHQYIQTEMLEKVLNEMYLSQCFIEVCTPPVS
jgi:hypothetical protein